MDNVPPSDAPDPILPPAPAPPSEAPGPAPVIDTRDETIAMLTRQNGLLQAEVDRLTTSVAGLSDQEQLVADLRVQLATSQQELADAVQDRNLYKAVYEQLDATFTDVKAKLPTKENP